MGMVVQHNMNAINAYNRLNVNVSGMKKASEKLSSGYRINRAGDDAAGLAISEKMRSQIRGLGQAKRNAQDGISMIQTFEGAAQETHSILQRMKELATESANGTYDNATDRAAIQLEFDHLNDELNQIADTDFNGTIVLNGGEMADGLKAEGGNFDYANLDKQIAEARKANALDLVAEGDYVGKAPELQDAKYVAGDPTATGKLWDVAVNTDKMEQYKDANEIYIKYSISGVDKDTGAVTGYKGEYVDANGKVLSDKYTSTLTVTANGGVQDSVTGVNIVMDTIGGKVGDYAIVKYTKTDKVQAPTNFGIIDDYKDGKDGIVIGATDEKLNAALEQNIRAGVSLSVGDGLTDPNWKKYAAIQDFVKKLDGATLSCKVTDDDDATAGKLSADITDIVLKDADGNKVDLANGAGKAGSGTLAFTGDDGVITFLFEDQELFKVDFSQVSATGLSTDKQDVTLKLSVDGQRYNSDDKPNASLVATKKVDKSVSNANAFKNSTARMTYAENIILQTGARTKDAVNFSFNYNADKTADMGELKNNLNLSSRADGLNTANLSLATAKDANYAMDQIDKAINKTSMVRASFGAIQNRLEHKIDNLTTTNENLTEAESNIRDTDMAQTMMDYTKFNILQQAAQSMLAQANQQPQSILQLLG